MKFKELREKYRSKFPTALVSAAVKIALDMAGNMTGAYKKIEKMKRGLGDDPIVKDALRQANESVQEGMSPADKKKRLEMIKKAVEKLNAKNDAKAKADFLKQMKDMVDEEVLNELNFSYAFFDKADLNKYMMKALKLKGLTVVDSEKQAGGHYTVRVKADDKKIIAKSNSLALQAMSEKKLDINEKGWKPESPAAFDKTMNDKKLQKDIAKFFDTDRHEFMKVKDAEKKFPYMIKYMKNSEFLKINKEKLTDKNLMMVAMTMSED